jgi:hypothetical protein
VERLLVATSMMPIMAPTVPIASMKSGLGAEAVCRSARTMLLGRVFGILH